MNSLGWSAILEIPVDVTQANGPKLDLTTNFGSLSLAQVNNHVMTYIGLDGRSAQDSYMMQKAILATLSKEAHECIALQRTNKFTRIHCALNWQ